MIPNSINDLDGELKVDEINWPLTHVELAQLLGYKDANSMGSIFNRHKSILIKDKDYDHKKVDEHKYAPPEILWYFEGAVKVAQKSRNAKAKSFLKKYDIEQRVEASDESRTLGIICSALHGYTTCIRQYRIEGYQVDLYLPDLNIVVECDEHGHSHYSQWDEISRQSYIEHRLGCKFIRYDPIDSEAVGNIINQIIGLIFKP